LHLKGWESGLNTGDNDECFSGLDTLRREIKDKLYAIRIKAPTKPAVGFSIDIEEFGRETVFPISLQSDVHEIRSASQQVFNALDQLVLPLDDYPRQRPRRSHQKA
jgi:hypothetical protein